MCRMLGVPGASSRRVQELLLEMRQQARQSMAGPAAGERHPDGWGLVEASASGVRYLGRRAKDASADPEYERAVMRSRGAAGFLLAHLRQASRGRVAVPNTHPFIADGYAFCHNGTIHGDIELMGQTYEGDTDSERFFRRLLLAIRREAHVPTAIEATVLEIEALSDFTSLTFLLTDGRTLWAYRRVGQAGIQECGSRDRALACYGLGIGTSGGLRFLAQEPTHLSRVESWVEVPEDHLVVWAQGLQPEVRPLRLRRLA